jgi:hypothetical protein
MATFDTDKRAILSPCNEIHSIVVDALFIFGTKCERSNRHLTTSGLSKRRFAVGRAAKRTHFSFESSGQSSQPPVEFVSLRQICTAPNMPTYQQIIMTIPKCSGEYLVKLMRNHAKTIMENGGNVRGIENHGIKPLAERTRL